MTYLTWLSVCKLLWLTLHIFAISFVVDIVCGIYSAADIVCGIYSAADIVWHIECCRQCGLVLPT